MATPGIERALKMTALGKQTVPQRYFTALGQFPLNHIANEKQWNLIKYNSKSNTVNG